MATEKGVPKFTEALSPAQLAEVDDQDERDTGGEDRKDCLAGEETPPGVRGYHPSVPHKGFAEVEVEMEVDEDYEHEEETTLPVGDLPRHVGGTRFRPVPVKQAASRSPVRPALATYTPRFIRPSSSKPSK